MIVDEAGTVDTPELAELARLADQHHWRVAMVGDPRQFAAVGRGGMFAHLVDKFGAVELDQVHRFQHQWERQASLRLRTGDPGVLTDYDRYGRIHDGALEAMEAQVIEAWKEARGRGETVALMANTTETVQRLNTLAQQTRIEAGELDAEQGTDPTREIGSELRSLDDDLNQEAADSWVSDEERGLRIRRYALRILQVSYVDSEIPFFAKVEA